MAAGTEVPTKEMRVTILALHIIYHVGWNIHTVQASVGPDCLGILNFLSTQIFACFGDLVAKVAFCAVVTALRIQVCGGGGGGQGKGGTAVLGIWWPRSHFVQS